MKLPTFIGQGTVLDTIQDTIQAANQDYDAIYGACVLCGSSILSQGRFDTCKNKKTGAVKIA